jgi:hypothetical protein
MTMRERMCEILRLAAEVAPQHGQSRGVCYAVADALGRDVDKAAWAYLHKRATDAANNSGMTTAILTGGAMKGPLAFAEQFAADVALAALAEDTPSNFVDPFQARPDVVEAIADGPVAAGRFVRVVGQHGGLPVVSAADAVRAMVRGRGVADTHGGAP